MSTRTPKDKPRIDIAEIQKLIRMIERSPINEFELVENDLKIRISKNGSNGAQTMISVPQMPAMQAANYAPAIVNAQPVGPESKPATASNLIDIKAPMVGTFYRAASPDTDPYVRIGDMIEPGKVLCIIEAMKLMNEIEAEFRGRVVDVLVENAQPLEFGQVMFRIERIG